MESRLDTEQEEVRESEQGSLQLRNHHHVARHDWKLSKILVQYYFKLLPFLKRPLAMVRDLYNMADQVFVIGRD